MTATELFNLTGPVVMLGWLALALSPLAPRVAQWVATFVPLVFATLYTGLILAHWVGAKGGFTTLADVQLLFTQPEIALAGWVHYLAFDLFVGAWITRTARAEAIHHAFILPCLALTFLFGPAGLLAFAILRFTLARKVLP